ncbi:MAG: hypothetical protein SFY66_27065 [Oculatellaceae cyanobacterium bins.114]|nr:hypothetical protein [Oculatellaceae cyanobacterium bins.114]
MKSNSDSATRKPNSGTGHPAGQSAGNGYAPSVPITVYRELAAELQATKAMMESMTAQNQHLVRQNQLLRQEIERVVHSALTLQQIAGGSQSPVAARNGVPNGVIVAPSTATHPEAIADLVRQAARPPQPRVERSAPTPDMATPAAPPAQPTPSEPNDALTNDLFSEIAEEPHRHEKRPPAKDMGGFWLTATIAVIVVTAFGAGFLVVRPLLPGR